VLIAKDNPEDLRKLTSKYGREECETDRRRVVVRDSKPDHS